MNARERKEKDIGELSRAGETRGKNAGKSDDNLTPVLVNYSVQFLVSSILRVRGLRKARFRGNRLANLEIRRYSRVNSACVLQTFLCVRATIRDHT